jgi:hypothetical protein
MLGGLRRPCRMDMQGPQGIPAPSAWFCSQTQPLRAALTAAAAPARTALFPRLRAAADLLMMPKEALTDAAIRAEMLPGMGLARVVRLLQRFTPDDFAQEPLPAGARP